ncbi:MAG: hypothetical protein GY855_05540 [candidate division Zixibacteria bacterium]|nr:hypothetical protein [candidate division Zixibacteria bacterium]
MAMMSSMRQYTKVVLWVVIVAFIGTIVFAWGMGQLGSDDPTRRGVIGVIDGHEISFTDFASDYEQEYEKALQESEDGEIDEVKAKEMREIVWNRMLEKVMMSNFRDKLNITVSDKELVGYLQNYPPQEIQMNPSFQTDGKFDYNKYLYALTNPENDWRPVEAYYRQQLMALKVSTLLMTPIYVTEDEVREDYENQNTKASFEYVYFPIVRPNDLPEFTNDEIRDFYEENKNEKFPDLLPREHVDIKLAEWFPVVKPEDEQSAITYLNGLRDSLLAGTEINSLVSRHSKSGYVSQGGGLPWNTPDGFVPNYAKTILGLKKGEISEPFRSRFGYHIARVDAIREVVDPATGEKIKEFKTSHILAKVKPDTGKNAELESSLNSLKGVKNLKEFENKAGELGGVVTETGPLVRWNRAPDQFTRLPELWSWAQDLKKKGEIIGGPFKTKDNGFFMGYITELIPNRPIDFSVLRGHVLPYIQREKGLEAAQQQAINFLDEITNPSAFKRLARKYGLEVKEAKEITKGERLPDHYIIEQEMFKSVVFKLDNDNRISKLIRMDSGVFVVRLLEKKEYSEEIFATKRDSVFQTLLNDKQQRVYYDWYSNNVLKMDIQDYRTEYYPNN